MNKGIWAIIVAAAFVGGTVFSADLASAAKPITEVFVTNEATNPVPTSVTNDVTDPVPTTVTNEATNPVPVTGSVNSVCPAGSIQHWDKIIFEVVLGGGELSLISPDGETELEVEKEYDIKVLDDPNEVADLKQKTADKLNDIGYQKFTIQGPKPIRDFNVEIIDVEYAIACTGGGITPPGR